MSIGPCSVRLLSGSADFQMKHYLTTLLPTHLRAVNGGNGVATLPRQVQVAGGVFDYATSVCTLS
jgi:hypothetical protein